MVKTDFKNTYEAFMHCDKNKLAKEFAAMYSDNEEQTAAVKEIDSICQNGDRHAKSSKPG